MAQPIKLFLSSTIWRQGGPTFVAGRPHYSYEIARRKLEPALRYLRLELHDVPRPEIYASPVSRAFLDENSCHLMFKPAESIRLIKGIRNIAWVAWDFDRLTGQKKPGPQHPFADMRRMLAIPDEIWTPCEMTWQVFRSAGIANVHRIPAPIAVPKTPTRIRFPNIPPDLDKIAWINLRIGFGRYAEINQAFPSRPHRLSDIILDFYGGRQPLVITTLLRPQEPRKNLTALVGGFLEFHHEHPEALLLIKLVVDNNSDRLDNVLTGVLRSCISGYELIDSNAIWLATDYFAEPVLADLYRFSAAYLCSSLAEGQNPPLQEAMAWGAVPVTPRHAAMQDYISKANAVIVRWLRHSIDRHGTALGLDPDSSWQVCTSADVARALRRLAGLSEDARRELGMRAHATIAGDFSVASVAHSIQSRFFQRR
ncbi:MAG: glycosyltransferase [Alphaproteobacteria bacterium]|nr:glycosyltransferase [Alphaproteobacteria bacterium]